MAIQVKKVDFSYFRGLVLTKLFSVTEVVAGVVEPYDMTGKVINLEMRDRADPPNLLYTILGIPGIGTVSFTFTNLQTDLASISDFQIVETPAILLQYGSADFTLAQNYVPFTDLVENEQPPGLVVPLSYVSLKAMEWRVYLQKAITPGILDGDVQNEAAWPFLVNILIAKLIVFDFIIKSIKSLMASSTLGSAGSGANIKKITTGPTDVEYFDAFASLAKFFAPTAHGSALDNMAIDICQLAKRVRVYLPLCNNPNTDPIVPLKAGRPAPLTLSGYLLKNFSV